MHPQQALAQEETSAECRNLAHASANVSERF